MNFSQWLSEWLTRHPLKEPASSDPARYTAEVMQRVKRPEADRAGATVPDWRAWWAWPQAGLSWTAVAAGLVVAVWGLQGVTGSRLAERRITQEVEVLAQLDEPGASLVEPELGQEAADLDAEELLMLAEAPQAAQNDEAWVTQTLQLLDKLDQAPEETVAPAGNSEEDMLKELEILDSQEMAASS